MKKMSNEDEYGVITWSMREATILSYPMRFPQQPTSVSEVMMSQLTESEGTNQKRRKYTCDDEDQSTQLKKSETS